MPVLSEWFPVWFEGSPTVGSVAVDTPSTWPVAIGGHGYMIEPSLYKRRLVPVQRDPRDETTEPGEASLSPAGLWRRSQSDWSLGAGQRWLDEEGSTRRRFWQSLGIDIFTERQFMLLPETTERQSTAETNLRLFRADTRLYVVDGATLSFSDAVDGEQDPSWSGFTDATGLAAGDILDVAFWGSHVIVLDSDTHINAATVGTAAFTDEYDPTAVLSRIWVAHGRLIGSDGSELFEITDLFGTPGETSIFAHPNSNMVWSALVGTPQGIYVAGNIGVNGEVRFVAVDDTGAFTVPIVTAEFPNEQVFSLASSGNNLLIGTSNGLRYAPLSSANTGPGLDFGPVITAVGSVREIIFDSVDAETFAWFTWSSINDGSESGLGRVRLSRFSEPLVPAYASDIYTEAGGTVVSVASIRGRRYFAVSGDGFYGATGNFVESGTIDAGRIRYGMLDLKVYADLKWATDALPDGSSVFADLTADTGQEVQTNTQTVANSTGFGPVNLGPIFAEWLDLEFTLTRGGVLTGVLLIPSLTTASLASTPDDATFAVTDLDVRVHVQASSWAPGGFGTAFVRQAAFPSNIAWIVGLSATGFPTVSWSTDGTATSTATSTVLPSLLPDQDIWFRYTLDVNNGAGGKTATFEISSDGVTYDVLDTVTTAGTTSIFNSTADVEIMGLFPFPGDVYVYEMQFLASIAGAEVANPSFDQVPGTASFADDAGNTWTMEDDAEIAFLPGSDATSPVLRSWVLRAIPSPETTIEFLVPIRLAHKVTVPHGPTRALHSNIELEFLTSLANTQAIVKYQEGHSSWDVHVVNFEATGTDWDKTASHMETIVVVQLHAIR